MKEICINCPSNYEDACDVCDWKEESVQQDQLKNLQYVESIFDANDAWEWDTLD